MSINPFWENLEKHSTTFCITNIAVKCTSHLENTNIHIFCPQSFTFNFFFNEPLIFLYCRHVLFHKASIIHALILNTLRLLRLMSVTCTISPAVSVNRLLVRRPTFGHYKTCVNTNVPRHRHASFEKVDSITQLHNCDCYSWMSACFCLALRGMWIYYKLYQNFNSVVVN